MKKLIIGFVCMSLVIGSMASAATMSPSRIWKCFSKPKENNCTTGEIVAADAAIAAGGVVLTAALAALGIGAYQIQKAKEERSKVVGVTPQEPVGETAADKNRRNLQQIESNIITLKLDLETNQNKLAQKISGEEQAKIVQAIKNIQRQINALEDAKRLVGTTESYQWK